MGDTATIAYCGPAAVPGDLLTRWNFDPLLMTALAALAIVIVSGRVANARAGWASLLLMMTIFISPLCALSSALFSARVLHHVLLIASVAPLLALAFPVRRMPSPPLAALVGLHTIILWVWHMPGTLRMGARQRTCLLADAGLPSPQCMVALARDFLFDGATRSRHLSRSWRRSDRWDFWLP